MTFSILTGAKTVTGSIRSWQNYAKVDPESVLADAEGMVFTRLRVREMRTSENLTVAVGAGSIDLPDGFLDPIKTRDITNNFTLDPKSEEALEEMRSWTAGVLDSGDPSAFGIYDESFMFDCKTTTAWKLRSIFYKKPDLLSESNERSFLTDRYPHMFRMACLAVAARFEHNEELFQREQRLCFSEIDEINARDELARRGQDNPVT